MRGALFAFWLLAAQEVPPDVLLIAKAKVRAEENLRHLPNYTCTQTIERSRRRSPNRKFELLDTVRLEVALVAGKELYSWPGADAFEERELRDMVGGTIGTGDFALFAKAVFLSGTAIMQSEGKEVRDGRETYRLRFVVPRLVSGYNMRVGSAEGIVGYEGNAWVDASSLDLLRLELITNDIPSQLPLLKGVDVITYERTKIGDADFLLPKSSEMVLTDFSGADNRNFSVFSRCRQYGSSSLLTFGDPPPSDATPAPPITFQPPSGVELPLRLLTPLRSPELAKGDSFEAEVTRDVRRKNEVVIPKGARVHGRVIECTQYSGKENFVFLGLELRRIRFENKEGALAARLLSPDVLGFPTVSGGMGQGSSQSYATLVGVQGKSVESAIYIRGTQVDLRPGFNMRWLTK